jgi:polyisoprenoid-binding protein YceI
MITRDETQVETQSTWHFDAPHTLVEFSAKHLMITTVKGHFKNVRGMLEYDEADLSRSRVEAEIEAASLYTGTALRDHDLRSAHFLEVERYPSITFQSTRVDLSSREHGQVIGDLTIHGVTREVALDTTLSGRGKNLEGQEVIAFEAKTSINRKDFGLHWNVLLETGGVLVGEIIGIEIAVECVR